MPKKTAKQKLAYDRLDRAYKRAVMAKDDKKAKKLWAQMKAIEKPTANRPKSK
jgi:hypothetical protein